MSDLNVLAAKAVESGGKLSVRSALNPILWLCAIVSVPAFTAAAFMTAAPNWIITLAFLPVGAAVLGFFFLLVVDRDKLQSEEYQIQKRSLELMEQKGDAGPVVIPVNSTVAVTKAEVINELPNRAGDSNG